MQRYALLLLLLLPLSLRAQKLPTRFELSDSTQSPPYAEAMAWWRALDKASPLISMRAAGPTDSGEPLQLVLYSPSGESDLQKLKKEGKSILFINNAIHPGEPDGVDASMLLLRELAFSKRFQQEVGDVVIALIPFYNIGGALNRNSTTRANQNGPEAYGFRGNARNLDLNRDFIKLDSRNAHSFTELFLQLKPQLYVETHVSNGADYPYTMTLLSTQHNKLGGPLAEYLRQQLEPRLYQQMAQKGWPMTPYVNVWGSTPDKGWVAFNDPPRYSSGFAALHHTIGLVTETHMLKPYNMRVAATYQFLLAAAKAVAQEGKKLQQLQLEQQQHTARQQALPLQWVSDTSQHTPFRFRGYEGRQETSAVSGQPRLRYDRSKPFEKEIKLYDTYRPTGQVQVPRYYVLPQGWWPVVERLKANGVLMRPLQRDSSMQAEVYRIADYKTVARPYEGHYLHHSVVVEGEKREVKLRRGDLLIPTDQPARRFLVEVLEPAAPDSYFSWNFFDAILQQKEGFSGYVFEDVAAELLKKNPALKKALEEKRAAEPDFAKDGAAQLEFIYKRSPYYEEAHLRYPVYRVF
ncbi:M14 family zinc carboxypeptidase [Cesiribacter andamanensis]|uniref:Zinc carboxypeptidase n=1 Tax=Cesiribacter andamanensis AMV16 TaxID=1279009 RepID=M7NSK5_9BACT|nr:M14 family zinc carboxypeptidase [Cesiribacter andamanensis]EMR01469.1 Zinc carboxypeptidase [Cesiribacter andamanensis AMV16]